MMHESCEHMNISHKIWKEDMNNHGCKCNQTCELNDHGIFYDETKIQNHIKIYFSHNDMESIARYTCS